MAVPRAELEAILERRPATKGERWANQLRDRAWEIAPRLGMEEAFTQLDRLVGVLLGTRKGRVTAPPAAARAAGEPYDGMRLERFSRGPGAKRGQKPADRADPVRSGPAFENLAFFDAYFSNFIEGTSSGSTRRPISSFGAGFPRHARPIRTMSWARIAWWPAVTRWDAVWCRSRRIGPSSNRVGFAPRDDHAGWPEKRPGQFKEEANYAGDTDFVDPLLVNGTLRKRLELLPALTEPFQRAVYMMFLISEVHLFDDGNGRLARAMMNAELIAGGQRRILIPTSFRIEYVSDLRRLTRQDAPDTLIEVLDYAQGFAAAVDFTDFDKAEVILRDCRAFEADEYVRLRMPSSRA